MTPQKMADKNVGALTIREDDKLVGFFRAETMARK